MQEEKEQNEFALKFQLLWAGPILALTTGFLTIHTELLDVPSSITLGIAIWTALWWIFEVVPIRHLLSHLLSHFLRFFPQQVAEKYGHPLVLLLLGGFLLSKAMEKSGAHRRIALMMVNACPSMKNF